jgi:pimeloyl-ACP methyl ester carboxylesterase
MNGFQFTRLSTKPTARICYEFQGSSSATKPCVLVFLNGLGLPQAAWAPTVTRLKDLREGKALPCILTYDRFGQGLSTDRDPQDEQAADPAHGHDCLGAVGDLRQLLAQLVREQMHISDLDTVALVLVANSLGCALARLYAQAYPGTVAALLLLDSVLANSDFVSIFPDADGPGFAAGALPEGITPEALREARESVGRVFHPSVGSREGISRRNLATLLPASDAPVLRGPGSLGPFVTVVGHDFDAFAGEAERMGRPRLLTETYVNPYWHAYNEGLARITAPERSKGPLLAPRAGHFIQKDNPDFVAQELDELLSRIM